MKKICLFTGTLGLIVMLLGFQSTAAQSADDNVTTLAIEVVIPQLSSNPISDLAPMIENIGLVLRKAAAAQNANCYAYSISSMSIVEKDVHLIGYITCRTGAETVLHLRTLANDFKKSTGFDAKILPPPGGGATINN